eukprot:scaffold4339_cov100-Skeletonema_dohrnii-CCMP3373.AAC.2
MLQCFTRQFKNYKSQKQQHPQCDANGSVTAPTAESVDTSSGKVVGDGGTMSEVFGKNAPQKGQIIQTQLEEIIIPCHVEQKIEDSQIAAATLL